MHLEQFFVDGLGHASYLLACPRTGDAAVVDPRRDVEVYLDALARGGFRLRYALETHVHNDFLSGARILAARTGAQHVASATAGLRFRYQGVSEGCALSLGSLELAVLETPGHTPEHVSYVVVDTAHADTSLAVFTGGDLLVGGVGRVDLLGPALAKILAPQLYDSLFNKLLQLPATAGVLPTHGPGSLCGNGQGTNTMSTIGDERLTNPALQHTDRDDFVRHVLSFSSFTPRYYRRMRRANQVGAAPIAMPAPFAEPLTLVEVRHALGHGAVVLDTRPPEAFGAGHLAGALHVGAGPTLPTWVGTLLELETPLLLVLDDDDNSGGVYAELVTALARIGFEHMVGFSTTPAGGPADWRAAGLPVATVEQISPAAAHDLLARGRVSLLDVRTPREWDGRRIDGAQHIPLDVLPDRLGEVSISAPVAIICGSGYRSSIATSLLGPRLPFPVLNVTGGISAWIGARLPLSAKPTATRSRGDRAGLPGAPARPQTSARS